MKVKRVGKKDANTKTTQRCVIKEETEVLRVKSLCRPPSGNRSTRQSVGIYELAKDPPSLIYPKYLSPPSSYSNEVTPNLCLIQLSGSCNKLHVASAILGFFQCFPAAPNSHLTLWQGVLSVWAINLLIIWKWRGRSWEKSTSKCVEICGYSNL